MQFPWPRSRGVAWALVAAVLAVPALANAQPQPQQPAAENPAPATTPPDTAAENPAPAPTSPETEAENPAPAPTSPETEAENPAPEDQEQPSDDDLAELSAALGADAAEVAESQPAA
ncbi:MAG TPA: hypothetical protein VFG83_14515, partial [Kofleriaceae bacterium]|nr:hypothetical protein [Kofleriaceae bacterium]